MHAGWPQHSQLDVDHARLLSGTEVGISAGAIRKDPPPALSPASPLHLSHSHFIHCFISVCVSKLNSLD